MDNFPGCVEVSYTGEGPTVAVLGDSITHLSRDHIHRALGHDAVKLAGMRGITIEAAQRIADGYASDAPDVVVIDLDTNDAWTGVPLDTIYAGLDTMFNKFSGSCIVAVTLTEYGTQTPTQAGNVYSVPTAASVNAWLRQRPDVHVVEWSNAAGSDVSRYLDNDGIHPSEEGKRLLADLISEAVDSCPAT